uniref:VWFA domain-containing protein n=1 Tax=Plectus sambesii TaxID=2011161 RepID=A0A914WZN5_9BILA
MYLKAVLLVFFVQSAHVFAQSSQCSNLDLLFVIDESQSMLLNNGFENGKNFVLNVVKAFSAVADARFAWVTFNSKVWEQTPFQTAQEFSSIVQSTGFNTGSSDYLIGFTAAKQTLSDHSKTTGTGRETVVIFFTDGHPTNGGDVSAIADVTKQIRCDQKTRILGLGIGEEADSAATIQAVIGVDDASGSCSKASYETVPNFGSVASQGVGIVQRLLGCQGF